MTNVDMEIAKETTVMTIITKKQKTKLTHMRYNYQASKGEKKIKEQLTNIAQFLVDNFMSMESIEKIIYSNNLLESDLICYRLTVRSENYLKMLDKFVEKICHNFVLSRQIGDLFKPFLQAKYKKKYFIFEEEDVSILKEIIWTAKYMKNKKIGYVDLKDEFGLIKALLLCDDNYIKWLDESKGIISRKIIINICSYKNALYDLMQYPECLNIQDLQEMTDTNLPRLGKIMNDIVNIPLINFDRYKIHRFISICIKEKLCQF